MQFLIDFIFYLYVYSTCFERQELITRSPFNRTYSLQFSVLMSVCLRHCLLGVSETHLNNRSIQTDAPLKASFLQDSAADRHQHRKLEAVCKVKGLLMMSA
jgi:hypothetical protein